ncbi:MAG: zinc ribbon domain-containing protein [Deferrisomatales bacterium]|nr:zinc ribbon domain-containing protein [Deferrisomatales bacterium]
MPIYEYHCTACDENFEVSRKITEGPLAACPSCHGKVEKLISQSSFVLKGSGWYKTDYAGKGKKDATPAPACASSGSKSACAGCPSAAD